MEDGHSGLYTVSNSLLKQKSIDKTNERRYSGFTYLKINAMGNYYKK